MDRALDPARALADDVGAILRNEGDIAQAARVGVLERPFEDVERDVAACDGFVDCQIAPEIDQRVLSVGPPLRVHEPAMQGIVVIGWDNDGLTEFAASQGEERSARCDPGRDRCLVLRPHAELMKVVALAMMVARFEVQEVVHDLVTRAKDVDHRVAGDNLVRRDVETPTGAGENRVDLLPMDVAPRDRLDAVAPRDRSPVDLGVEVLERAVVKRVQLPAELATAPVDLDDRRADDVVKLRLQPGFLGDIIRNRDGARRHNNLRLTGNQGRNRHKLDLRVGENAPFRAGVSVQAGERASRCRQDIHLGAEVDGAEVNAVVPHVGADVGREDGGARGVILEHALLVGEAADHDLGAEMLGVGQKVAPERRMDRGVVLGGRQNIALGLPGRRAAGQGRRIGSGRVDTRIRDAGLPGVEGSAMKVGERARGSRNGR